MSSEKKGSDGGGGSDPRALRALAHPVRLDLLYLLEREGPLTASRAAELLGLSAKVCSYHLGTLGKYGVIEETHGGKGRARPWRLREIALGYTHDPDEEPEATHAADAFAAAMLARDARVVEEFIRRRHRLPQRWRNVSAMSSTPLRLTPEELRELRAELLAVLHRYAERGGAPDPGAHPVHTAVYAVPTGLGVLTAREED
ncbi:ArsR/SmtB family transcription factor [Streptomyces sp. MAR4 CNX-425]|uniref:ArsR/SmtB family transcription factor n=1 Tax=Streptomyces sp. MAR4 CNX-425 TaxID=3406343 RepID=UPI003B50079F